MTDSSGFGQLQRTYSGLLDDVMIRYSRDYASDAFFNKMIAKNLLFGGGIYLNDGYLVNHETARKNLYLEDGLLRQMINNGFIRILTRTSNPDALFEMPRTMAQSGNTSFARLLNSPEWQDFEPLFRSVSSNVFHTGNARKWPKFDMSFGFTKLISRTLSSPAHEIGITEWSDEELEQLSREFFSRDPKSGNSRDTFEKAAIAIVGERGSRTDFNAAMRQIMDIANQAYHYNFGLTLTEEENSGIVVDTTFGPAFDELLQTQEIEQGDLDDFPLLQLPDNLPFEDGAIFLPFLDATHSVGKVKKQYVEKMRALLDAQGVAIAEKKRELTEATTDYLDEVKSLFARKYGQFSVELEFEDTFLLARGLIDSSSGAPSSVVATAAPTGGLAITLRDQAMNQSRELLVERFRLRNVSDDFRRNPADTVTVRDIRPQITSLAFNPNEATKFVTDIPRFK